MYKNGLKYAFLICMVAISRFAVSQPPFVIDKAISPNKIVNFNNQKLLIIDFWATWCPPCIPATKQLEILQETMPDDVFIVSVSDETEETISAYLQKRPIRLAVFQDYLPDGLIKMFNVQSRPYAVLLTLDGEILYRGHPSGITAKMITGQAAQLQSQPKKKLNSLFVEAQQTNSKKPVAQNNKDFYIVKQAYTEQNMYSDDAVFYYTGLFSGLIGYLTDTANHQIILENIPDDAVSMHCSQSKLTESKSAILQLVEKELSITVRNSSKAMEAVVLDVVNPDLLWDNRQISWSGDAGPAYIVGTDRIEADNMTLTEIANVLSNVKGKRYFYRGNDNRTYDWDFHYLYDDLMKEDLESNFGINLKQEKITLPVYIVSSQKM